MIRCHIGLARLRHLMCVRVGRGATSCLSDPIMQVRTLDKVAQVVTVIRAVRDENFALAAALRDKGVALEPELDPTGRGFLAPLKGDAPDDSEPAGGGVKLPAKASSGPTGRHKIRRHSRELLQ